MRQAERVIGKSPEVMEEMYRKRRRTGLKTKRITARPVTQAVAFDMIGYYGLPADAFSPTVVKVDGRICTRYQIRPNLFHDLKEEAAKQ